MINVNTDQVGEACVEIGKKSGKEGLKLFL
jgi:hypothetical protein